MSDEIERAARAAVVDRNVRVTYSDKEPRFERPAGDQMDDNGTYDAPTLVRLGSIHELTQQQFNKIGQTNDIYTAITQNQVIGSLVPVD